MNDQTRNVIAEAAKDVADLEVYNVRVPEGGFLAVVFKGHPILNAHAQERMTKALEAVADCKVIVFSCDVTLVGVGPEGGAA